ILQRCRVEPARRNDISRKRPTVILGLTGKTGRQSWRPGAACRKRIVDRSARASSVITQISGSILDGRDSLSGRLTLAEPEAFIVHEEERPVAAVNKFGNIDRAAEVEPELILREGGTWSGVLIVEERIRVEDSVSQVF